MRIRAADLNEDGKSGLLVVNQNSNDLNVPSQQQWQGGQSWW